MNDYNELYGFYSHSMKRYEGDIYVMVAADGLFDDVDIIDPSTIDMIKACQP